MKQNLLHHFSRSDSVLHLHIRNFHNLEFITGSSVLMVYVTLNPVGLNVNACFGIQQTKLFSKQEHL